MASMNQHYSYRGTGLIKQVLPPINRIASIILKNNPCQLNEMKGIKQRVWLLDSIRYVDTHGEEESCYILLC